MNRRSILAAYKKKSSHLQTGVTGFKSGNLFNQYHEVLAQEKPNEPVYKFYSPARSCTQALLRGTPAHRPCRREKRPGLREFAAYRRGVPSRQILPQNPRFPGIFYFTTKAFT